MAIGAELQASHSVPVPCDAVLRWYELQAAKGRLASQQRETSSLLRRSLAERAHDERFEAREQARA